MSPRSFVPPRLAPAVAAALASSADELPDEASGVMRRHRRRGMRAL